LSLGAGMPGYPEIIGCKDMQASRAIIRTAVRFIPFKGISAVFDSFLHILSTIEFD